MAGRWTAADMPDQTGRLAIVTGANSGLGRWRPRASSPGPARRVIVACRNIAKGDEAAARIRQDVPGAELRVEQLDLADLDSVRVVRGRARRRTASTC